MDGLCRSAEHDGNPAIPLVKALGQHVKAVDSEAARYVHLGATSQDVIDTGLMLCTKKALEALLVDLIELEERLDRFDRTASPDVYARPNVAPACSTDFFRLLRRPVGWTELSAAARC